jgi:hypothetical protein
MKIERISNIRSGKPLPEVFSKNRRWKKLIAHESRVKMTGGARLYLKLLVFDTWQDMGKLLTALGRPHTVDSRTQGLCSRLDWVCESYKTDPPTIYTEVDPNYFALIGLIKGKINLEVVAHEATHAAFAYAERSRKKWTDPEDDNPEECVCYPVGKLTSLIWDHLIKEGLIPLDPI